MQRTMLNTLMILGALLALGLAPTACGKAQDSQDQRTENKQREEASGARLRSAPSTTGKDTKQEFFKNTDGPVDREKGKDSLSPILTTAGELAKDRLLEYHVSLGYECTNLAAARRELIALVTKYGFIQNSAANADGKHPSLTIRLAVKSALLYDALRDLDRLGRLKSEHINVTDLTEQMTWAKRKAEREQVRVQRRALAQVNTGPGTATWTERENQLQQSEDAQDTQEHTKWKTMDRVAWAQVAISLSGPERPDAIEVPDYLAAVKGAVTVLLGIGWVLLFLLPIALVLFPLWYWARKGWRAWKGRAKS